MRKLFFGSLLLICLSVLAQETATTEETTEINEEVVAAPVEEPKENWIECDTSYLSYVKNLPAAQQSKELENWWEYADYDYHNIKNDEFRYKEEKPKREKQFKTLLSEKDAVQSILLNIKLGQYDFKKKGFPVDIKTAAADKTFENHYDANASGFGGGLGGAPSATLNTCSMKIKDSKKSEELPGIVKIKPNNIAKIKFISVAEEAAKKVTAEIGKGRIVTAVVRYQPVKTAFVKKKLGTIKINELVVTADIKELEFNAGEDKLNFKF
ncbi:DUF4852 domain-containing protein [bacterium]|nr:DUF4852 domain-containing protein [bacterium]